MVLRWAILGTGFISNTVAEAIAQSEGSELAAVAGRSTARAEAFAVNHGIAKVFGDYDAVLADPNIDVVYIGLPNHAHLPMVAAAASAGKAILSEKSLTVTHGDAVDLIDRVRSAGVFFVEGLMYLSHPIYSALGEVLADGRLGTVRSVNGIYAADIKDVVHPAGGGTLYNLGCYPASLLHFVMQSSFGEDAFSARRVTATGNLNSERNICDTAISVRFENGTLATLQSTDSYGMHHSFEIVGELGSLRFATNPWLPVGGENVLEVREHKKPVERVVVSDGLDAFAHQVRMVERCLASGELEAPRPSPRWKDSLEIMAFLNEWEAAARG